MTSRQTAAYSRYMLLMVQEYEKTLEHTLDASDRLLLVDTLTTLVPRMITKFINGAKLHPIPLIDRVSYSDIDEELIDAIFYVNAHRKRQQRLL